MRPLLSARTQRRIKMFGGPETYIPFLKEHVHEDQLPEMYGGTLKEGPRTWGIVPLLEKTQPLGEEREQTATVKRGSEKDVRFCFEGGKVATWRMRIESRDVDIEVLFEDENGEQTTVATVVLKSGTEQEGEHTFEASSGRRALVFRLSNARARWYSKCASITVKVM